MYHNPQCGPPTCLPHLLHTHHDVEVHNPHASLPPCLPHPSASPPLHTPLMWQVPTPMPSPCPDLAPRPCLPMPPTLPDVAGVHRVPRKMGKRRLPKSSQKTADSTGRCFITVMVCHLLLTHMAYFLVQACAIVLYLSLFLKYILAMDGTKV